MLTVKQVVARLGVKKSTVYAIIDAGLLPHHRIGVGKGTIRVQEKDLEEFIRRSRVEPTTAPGFRHVAFSK